MDAEERVAPAEGEVSQSASQTLDLSTHEIIAGAVADASPMARRALVLSLLSMLFVVVVALVDALTGTGGLEPYRLAGVILGMAGLTLLTVATVLHHAGQRRFAACERVSMFRVEARSLHKMLLVLPVMAIAAGVLMAFAIGLFIPSVIAKPIFVIVVALFSLYVIIAIRTVRSTTRFLYRHAREQAEAAAKAQSEATEAQLTALRAQMNPHFLFNALNTVASLVRTDGRAAEATVENLADILRRTLARSRNGSGTVREEIDYLKAYLAVEQERWGDRLRIDWAIPSDLLDLSLPPMTLQPLVENALKHGLGGRLEGGMLHIEAHQDDGQLILEVRDDGIGFPDRYEEGTGLGNLRQRLATLYGERAELHVESGASGSTVAVIIPVEPLPLS